jgi:hypothetical protein
MMRRREFLSALTGAAVAGLPLPEFTVGRVARIQHSNGEESRKLCYGTDIDDAQERAIEWRRTAQDLPHEARNVLTLENDAN